ncbi:cytochrome c nitrite reductase small subunit [Heliobacterium gestii]|uniref:Cytochrome c nitrite reductase small subunit n=1 Tax=Heliomicrobium gestii TaxID=2699 RepID=A0A845L5U0_HELGE|nr:NapC/NirT family cytochrome c [Heliomicrobium gestii]MBM7865307.1 cytochrome c nitrite reductase small subunit [Heliomicrobium gestii]MZP41568.1 cytochrome c nitrite reductase small subunit [Heliomicrobium gestii]
MDRAKKLKIIILAGGIFLMAAGAGTAAMHKITGNTAFCGTCHVMDNYMASWEHSSHREVAGCNDCHTDQRNYAAKTWSKVYAGSQHAFVNTVLTPPDHLKLYEASKPIIQRNCLRCHDDLVAQTNLDKAEPGGKSCFDCHRSTPHGRERPST